MLVVVLEVTMMQLCFFLLEKKGNHLHHYDGISRILISELESCAY